MESTGTGFRMRSINTLRNNSQKIVKSTVVGSFNSAQKHTKLVTRDNSDLNESKSLRNLHSDGSQSTGYSSSKINSDTTLKQPKLTTRYSSNQPIFKGQSPARPIQTRNRTLKRPQKVCALNNGQVMINRWMGVLKSRLPYFDLEDQKFNR